MPTTLAEKLEPSFVDFDYLHDRYRPMLALVRELIGVVPNCDLALEMWRPGFRTYNLLVPNCLDLPVSLLGRGARKDLVGLGMYVSSRAAECAYCSAHTCSFAIRRGASTEAIVGNFSAAEEEATTRLAEGMARIPADLTPDDVARLERLVGVNDAEDIALGITLMGFLNKFMDAMGIELEPEALADVTGLIGPTGWAAGQHYRGEGEPVIDLTGDGPRVDDMKTYGRVLKHGPAAARLERLWTRGVPNTGPAAEAYLHEHTGVELAILGEIRRGAMVRALATVVRDNLDPTISAVGLGAKSLAGWVYANHVDSEDLKSMSLELISRHHAGQSAVSLDSIASGDQLDALSQVDRAAVKLAVAVSPSPAAVSPELIDDVTEFLTPAEVVEVVVWVSVLQAIHRYQLFTAARRG